MLLRPHLNLYLDGETEWLSSHSPRQYKRQTALNIFRKSVLEHGVVSTCVLSTDLVELDSPFLKKWIYTSLFKQFLVYLNGQGCPKLWIKAFYPSPDFKIFTGAGSSEGGVGR